MAYYSLKWWRRKITSKLGAMEKRKLSMLKKNKKGIKVLGSLPLKLVKAVQAKYN